MTGPRQDLADALADAGGAGLSVFAEEPPTAPALPALFIRPGTPYRTVAIIPACLELWKVEVVALVPIDAPGPLDALDTLITLVRDVIRATPAAAYIGVQLAPAVLTIAGVSHRAAVVAAELNV